MNERRSKLELSYDIISATAIGMHKNEFRGPTTLKLTHIQLMTKMNYDKLKTRALKLVESGLLTIEPLGVTPKGFLFMQEWEAITKSTQRLETGKIEDNIDKYTAAQPVTIEHKILDYKQVINAQNAIIEELEK